VEQLVGNFYIITDIFAEFISCKQRFNSAIHHVLAGKDLQGMMFIIFIRISVTVHIFY